MAHELKAMGWDAYALTGGFNAWKNSYGAQSVEPDVDVEVTLAHDRL